MAQPIDEYNRREASQTNCPPSDILTFQHVRTWHRISKLVPVNYRSDLLALELLPNDAGPSLRLEVIVRKRVPDTGNAFAGYKRAVNR